jgi:hypothetical protein
MLTAAQVLDRYYLDTRCMLLEIAATLDRFDRAGGRDAAGTADTAERHAAIYRGLDILADRSASPDRAERLLMLLSDPAE